MIVTFVDDVCRNASAINSTIASEVIFTNFRVTHGCMYDLNERVDKLRVIWKYLQTTQVFWISFSWNWDILQSIQKYFTRNGRNIYWFQCNCAAKREYRYFHPIFSELMFWEAQYSRRFLLFVAFPLQLIESRTLEKKAGTARYWLAEIKSHVQFVIIVYFFYRYTK